MITIGIDPSVASTGIVVISDGCIVEERTHGFPADKDFQYLSTMYNIFEQIYSNNFDGYCLEGGAVAIEGYSYNSQGNTFSRLVELGTMLRYVATLWEVPTYIVAPQNLKKFVAGKTFKKDEMRLEVFKRWGFEHKSNDIVDAYALARYAQAIYNKTHKVKQMLTVFQNQAIDAWAKNKNGVYVEK